jgi:hypothetical protein
MFEFFQTETFGGFFKWVIGILLLYVLPLISNYLTIRSEIKSGNIKNPRKVEVITVIFPLFNLIYFIGDVTIMFVKLIIKGINPNKFFNV